MRVEALRGWAGAGLDLLYPPHCPVCERAVESGRRICGSCAEAVVRVTKPRCEVCSFPFAGMVDRLVCPNCRGHEFAFDCAVSVLRCRGAVRDLLHRLKYGRERHLRGLLGDWLLEALGDERLDGVPADLLVPVPLHPARQRERQFNQSEELAEWVGRRAGIPVGLVLQRLRYTETQTHFDRKTRMRNLQGAFNLRQNAAVTGKTILLVDDILTTGSTLDECARVLRDAGAESVTAITVARG